MAVIEFSVAESSAGPHTAELFRFRQDVVVNDECDAKPPSATCTLALSLMPRVQVVLEVGGLTATDCRRWVNILASLTYNAPNDSWLVVAVKLGSERGTANMGSLQGLMSYQQALDFQAALCTAAILLDPTLEV